MSETVWFRRGDGAEFAVPDDSEAYHNLVAAGALHIEGPSKAAPESGPAAATGPNYKELMARAKELGLPGKGTKAELAAAIAAAAPEPSAVEA